NPLPYRMTNDPSTPSVLERLTILGSARAAPGARAVAIRLRISSWRPMVAVSLLIPGAPLSVAVGAACGDDNLGWLLHVFRPARAGRLWYTLTADRAITLSANGAI